MSLLHYLVGKPLSSKEEAKEQVGVWDAIPVFGLDALGSAAYGPEAALTVLLSAGLLGLHYILAINLAIIFLLTLVYLSYMQTIDAYPGGGGAYVVASENLGAKVGLVAGAALLLDYLLNVCVGISTGIGAMVSAVPQLQRFTLPLCLGVLSLLIVVNLRGIRESGFLWRLPTFSFVACVLTVITVGLVKTWMGNGKPASVVPPPVPSAAGTVTLWLLLRSFAGGCTALTGVEAVSNGVPSFKDPKTRNAKRALTVIVILLTLLLVGLALVVRSFGITATTPGEAGYQSVLSLVTAAVLGRGWFYYLTISSIVILLSFSANTSFAGFPMVCRLMADDGYLPKVFGLRGRRLVYTGGILALGGISAIVLVIFQGVTDRLIPLFAIGAFLAFTFSQIGMMQYWRRSEGEHRRRNMVINVIGAAATGTTTLLVFLAKFTSGAWMTAIAIFVLVLLMLATRQHYDEVQYQVHVDSIELEAATEPPLLLLPVQHWNRASVTALNFACALRGWVQVLHVQCDEHDAESMAQWQTMLRDATCRNGLQCPEVIAISSQYRAITGPLFRYVLEQENHHPRRTIAVVFPELVAARWYQQALHNYRVLLLKIRLLFSGRRRVAIVNVPWQLSS